VATLVGVTSTDLNLSRDVISQSTSSLAALSPRFQDVASLQQAVNGVV
jgi:hypothetical protein